MFLAMPRDKDMLATFVHALAFFPCNSPRQGHVGNVRSCLGLFFLAIPRDKDMLATFIHALGVFVHALGVFSHLFFPNLLRSLEKGK
jgi:hypothetical protein